MKKVIFVCLLSLSVCISQASQPTESTAQDKQVTTQNLNPSEGKTPDTKTEHAETAAAAVTQKSEISKDLQSPDKTTTATGTNGTQKSNETSTKTNETKPTDKPNSTEKTETAKVTTEASSKPEDKAKENKEAKTTVSPAPPSTGTTADNKDNKKNETTTPKGETVSPTAAVPVEAKSRAFDGPSFIGGMILTLGLLAIGFMGFKYYKNQTERNYHTL